MNHKRLFVRKSTAPVKHTLFSIIVILLFFAVMEGSLRLTGRFDIPRLIIPVDNHEGWVQLNPGIATRFLPGMVDNRSIQMPSIHADRFARVKPIGEIRIAVLGGSSVQGYPYPYNVAFPSLLEILLSHSCRNNTVQVLNCGVTALNSYALVDLVRELLEASPDLIIIYSGHNEFYGAFGSGSSYSFSRSRTVTRWIMNLQKTSVYRFIRQLTGRLRAGNSGQVQKGLIEVMAKDQAIRENSKAVADTISNYGKNLRLISDLCAVRDVPVLLGTVVSNIEGLSPMKALPNKTETELNGMVREALTALSEEDFERALAIGNRLIEIDPEFAWGQFLSGKASLGLNRRETGCHLLQRARDLDGLRFRAHSGINDTVLAIASDPSDRIVSADLRVPFDAASAAGCPGYDLFVDHVHPTDFGHYLIAGALADAIVTIGLIPSCQFTGTWLSWEDCRREAGYTDIEKMLSLMQVVSLYGSYPLQSLPEARTRIQAALSEIRLIHSGLDPVLRDTYEFWVKQKGSFDIHFKAGTRFMELNDYRSAVDQFEIALKAHPDLPVIISKLQEASEKLNQDIRMDPENRQAGQPLIPHR
ncbi:SGNH/GDSL hydrolase family protein [bacterium]|nr:SGNH/GDSL hydrolase family protein [candidate division CSSED10-310 bacterium]